MVVEISGAGGSTGAGDSPPKTVLLVRPEFSAEYGLNGKIVERRDAMNGSDGDDGDSGPDENAHGQLAGLSIQTESIGKATAAYTFKGKKVSCDKGQEGVDSLTTSPARLVRGTRRNRKHESSNHISIQNGDLLAQLAGPLLDLQPVPPPRQTPATKLRPSGRHQSNVNEYILMQQMRGETRTVQVPGLVL